MVRRLLSSCALLVAVACTSSEVATPGGCPTGTVGFGAGRHLQVQIAEDRESQAEGLMGVTELAPDAGMAFLYPAPTTGTFWMKNTLIPLSIAFADAHGRIVTIREMAPCEADPCVTYRPDAPYTMAIEANAGWFGEQGIEVGDRARLQRASCR